MLPVIFALSGDSLTADERDFFRDAEPAGYILFARNCVRPDQVRRLTDDLRDLSGRDDLPILIDQEGGAIVRLKPPVWPALPGPGPFDDLYRRAPMSAIEAMRCHGEAIASMLREAGITVNCAPLLDLNHRGAHPIITRRALGSSPMQVAALARAMLEGMRAAGVAGVVKHMPGQGRALADSHLELPVVTASEAELQLDLEPFRTLARAPIGMTAHVVFSAWDAEACATLSDKVIAEVIRDRIGFAGLLITDDIAMDALTGGLAERAQAALTAGCDLVLHCSGDLRDMRSLADRLGGIAAQASARLAAAMAWAAPPADGPGFDELARRRDALLAYA